jgi:hypothetical protein
MSENKGELSDGYHTFNELYEHRHTLFMALMNTNKHMDFWKSKLHSDGTMFDDYFIAGLNEVAGKIITYHLPMSYWDLIDCTVIDKAPEWDGHTSNDVLARLKQEFANK